MSYSFQAGDRVRRRADFVRVQQQGRRVSGRFVTLLIHANDGTAPRLGLIASRKLGPAVARNRAKRRLREVFRLLQAHVPADCDLLMIARSSATTTRSSVETVMAEQAKLTDASMKLAEQAMAPLAARVTLAAEKFGRAA